MKEIEKVYYKTSEISKLLKVSVNDVVSLADRYDIPYRKFVNGNCKFKVSAFREIESHVKRIHNLTPDELLHQNIVIDGIVKKAVAKAVKMAGHRKPVMKDGWLNCAMHVSALVSQLNYEKDKSKKKVLKGQIKDALYLVFTKPSTQ